MSSAILERTVRPSTSLELVDVDVVQAISPSTMTEMGERSRSAREEEARMSATR